MRNQFTSFLLTLVFLIISYIGYGRCLGGDCNFNYEYLGRRYTGSLTYQAYLEKFDGSKKFLNLNRKTITLDCESNDVRQLVIHFSNLDWNNYDLSNEKNTHLLFNSFDPSDSYPGLKEWTIKKPRLTSGKGLTTFIFPISYSSSEGSKNLKVVFTPVIEGDKKSEFSNYLDFRYRIELPVNSFNFKDEGKNSNVSFEEQKVWEEAKKIDAFFSYNAYLSKYPVGVYAEEASDRKSKISTADHKASIELENALKKAGSNNELKRDAYLAYLNKKPESWYKRKRKEANLFVGKPHIKKKEYQNKDIKKPCSSQEEWINAQKVNTIISYRSYLNACEQSEFRDQANLLISAIENKCSNLILEAENKESIKLFENYIRICPGANDKKMRLAKVEIERLKNKSNNPKEKELLDDIQIEPRPSKNPIDLILVLIIIIVFIIGTIIYVESRKR